jgi:hypothetical protein
MNGLMRRRRRGWWLAEASPLPSSRRDSNVRILSVRATWANIASNSDSSHSF